MVQISTITLKLKWDIIRNGFLFNFERMEEGGDSFVWHSSFSQHCGLHYLSNINHKADRQHQTKRNISVFKNHPVFHQGEGLIKKYLAGYPELSVIVLMLLLSVSQNAWTIFLPVKIIKLNFLPENWAQGTISTQTFLYKTEKLYQTYECQVGLHKQVDN